MKAWRLAMGAMPFLFPLAACGQGGAPEHVEALAATCSPCHGPPGQATGGKAVPDLVARRDVAQRLKALRAAPPQTLMAQLARGLTDAEIEALGRYFATIRRP